MRRERQLELTFHGGRRSGAGRKPKGRRRKVPHRARPRFRSCYPTHVTIRAENRAPNFRAKDIYPVIKAALRIAADRLGCRIVHFSVMRNHLHLIVEAGSWEALSNAIRGLEIRLTHRVNALLGRTGPLMEDRYHLRVLKTPLEVKRALVYVLNNARKHAAELGRRLGARWIDPCSSAGSFDGWINTPPSDDDPVVSPAQTWLIRIGWREKHGAVRLDTIPGGT